MKCFLLSAALLLLAASHSRASLIVNGSFESFTISGLPNDFNWGPFITFFGPPETGGNTELTGWTIAGNRGTNPNNVDLVNHILYAPFVGGWSLDMEGYDGASGVIQQAFATTVGGTYHLSFAYANNPEGGGAMANVLVTGLGILLNQDVSHNTSTYANLDYNLFAADFVADSAITTLQFSALTNTGKGIALDAVSVDPVPEPSSALLLVLGLLGISAACKTGSYQRPKHK